MRRRVGTFANAIWPLCLSCRALGTPAGTVEAQGVMAAP